MLAPYRVLDLTNEWGLLCGRLLADLGADVIKIERPGGDPVRNIGPFYKDIPDPQKSLFWFFYNANKRGITLNIETADGKAIFKRLVEKADFVIESFEPGYLSRLGLGYDELEEINPRIILTSITPFGESGPYKNFKASDIVCLALSGWMYKCGDADRAPLQMGYPQAIFHAASQAAAATLMAHHHRQITGEGQQVDASPFPWMVYFAQAAIRWYYTQSSEKRHGQLWEWSGRPLIRYVWDCRDGAVCFAVMGGARFGIAQKAVIQWMDSEGMAPDYLKEINWDEMDYGSIGQDIRDRFEKPVAEFFKTKTKAEIFQGSIKRGISLFPANTAKEIFEDSQLRSRDYWTEVQHPELDTHITYPGAFFKSSETGWKIERRAPLIGEHNLEIYIDELGFSKEELILLKQQNII